MLLNKKHLLTIIVFLIATSAYCHNLNYDKVILHEWTVSNDTKIKASFLMFKNDEVYLEKDNAEVVHFPLTCFSQTDRQYIQQRINKIQNLNSENTSYYKSTVSTINVIDYKKIIVFAAMLITILLILC